MIGLAIVILRLVMGHALSSKSNYDSFNNNSPNTPRIKSGAY